MLYTELLLVLGSLTVLSLRGETAGAVCCQRSTYPTIQALPGKPGKNGDLGAPGPKGEPGVDGTDGEQGPVGPVGPQGSVGPVGLQGPVGPVGSQGIAGMNGTDGEQGPVGPVGPQGPVGAPGLDGRNGTDSSPGPPSTVPDAVIEQLRAGILEEVLKLLPCKGFFRNNPATSCKEIHECNSIAPSGYYWVRNATGDATQVFCEMNTTNCGNITGGWMRAAYINMTNTANSCPVGLTYYTQNSTRICSSSISSRGCTSVNFPTFGVPFTKVCGRALGYQYGHIDAFDNSRSIDSDYVEGLSVTHGTPRNHIWTFAAGCSKDIGIGCVNCPCASPSPGPTAPSFVGENFFVSRETLGHMKPSGTLMTLCGTHRGV